MKKLLRPLFRTVSGAYGAVARFTHPWCRLPPLRITLMVTNRCNLSCPYCYVREELNQGDADRLSLDEWRQVIDSIPRWMLVMLAGGEPFMAPDIMGILERLFDGRRLVSLVTNATRLDRPKIEFLVERKLRYMMVSLDGMAEYHNRMRGQADAFERVDEAFRTLNEVKREKNATYPVTCIKTTVTEDNHGEIPALLKFVENELRADHLSFSLLVQNPLQEGFKITEDLDDPRFRQGNRCTYPGAARPQVRRMIEHVLAYRKTSRMQIEFYPLFRRSQDLLEYIDDPSRFGVRRCTLPWIEFTVYYNGQATPCVTYLIDNVRNLGYDIAKVMKHPRYRAFLAAYSSRTPFAPPCDGCCWGRHVPK